MNYLLLLILEAKLVNVTPDHFRSFMFSKIVRYTLIDFRRLNIPQCYSFVNKIWNVNKPIGHIFINNIAATNFL